jgi:hypothetical protein
MGLTYEERIMGVIDGKNAAVNGQKTVFGWKITYDGNEADYVASNTEGGVGRVTGNRDWVGYFDSYGQTATPYAPTVFPGDSFSFDGTTETSKGATGTARCTRLVATWDTRVGRYITYRTFFGANGALTIGVATATDTTEPSPQHVKGLSVDLGAVQEDEVNFMRLVFTSGSRRYCTAECNGQYKRTAGDRMDVEAVWRVYEDTPANLPTIDSRHVAKFYVTAAQYWQITWLQIDQVDDLGVDRENKNEPVFAQITGRFTSHDGTSTGSIVDPAAATKWPVA